MQRSVETSELIQHRVKYCVPRRTEDITKVTYAERCLILAAVIAILIKLQAVQ